MTWELQPNSALKITFNLVFFKCRLAENSGVKVELSSRFLAWKLEVRQTAAAVRRRRVESQNRFNWERPLRS